jgi:hypothetical protein
LLHNAPFDQFHAEFSAKRAYKLLPDITAPWTARWDLGHGAMLFFPSNGGFSLPLTGTSSLAKAAPLKFDLPAVLDGFLLERFIYLALLLFVHGSAVTVSYAMHTEPLEIKSCV